MNELNCTTVRHRVATDYDRQKDLQVERIVAMTTGLSPVRARVCDRQRTVPSQGSRGNQLLLLLLIANHAAARTSRQKKHLNRRTGLKVRGKRRDQQSCDPSFQIDWNTSWLLLLVCLQYVAKRTTSLLCVESRRWQIARRSKSDTFNEDESIIDVHRSSNPNILLKLWRAKKRRWMTFDLSGSLLNQDVFENWR